MRRQKNEIIYHNPPPGLGASLVIVFVMGIIVWILMWHFKKSIGEIVTFAIVFSAIGRAFFSSKKR